MSSTTVAYAGGVTLSVVISAINSTGMGLQKRVHKELEARPPGERPYWRDKRWLAGLACMAAASILVLGNYALLGQARASAMASLTIVTNAIMAKYYLKEPFGYLDLATTACIVTGIVVAVVFGADGAGSTASSLDDLLAVLRRSAVYEASGAVAGTLVLLHAFIWYSERLGSAGKRPHWVGKVECFARAFTAGIFSGSTGFFAKAVVYSVKSSFAGAGVGGSLGRWQFWCFLVLLPLSIFAQLRTLNAGLRAFDAVEIVPIYQASIVTVGVAWGWIFYEENEGLPEIDEVMFAVGCGVSILGIGLLYLKKAPAGAAAGAGAGKGESTGLLDGGSSAAAPMLGGEAGQGSGRSREGSGSAPGPAPGSSRWRPVASPDAPGRSHAQAHAATAGLGLGVDAASDLAAGIKEALQQGPAGSRSAYQPLEEEPDPY